MKTTSKPTSELLGKLTRYTALAGAAGLGGSLAQAGITVWNSGATIRPPSFLNSATLYFDFESGTVQTASFTGADFSLSAQNGLGSNCFYARRVGPVNLVQSSNNAPARLASGDPVSAAQNFLSDPDAMASGGTQANGNWADGGQGYLGFQFDIGGETHYGWADVALENITSDEGLPKITLNRFAYNETADEGLLAGQTEVPEPESALPMALLVLGAAGLGRYRRQRAAQTGPDGEKTAT